jgi:hypothetical protein
MWAKAKQRDDPGEWCIIAVRYSKEAFENNVQKPDSE